MDGKTSRDRRREQVERAADGYYFSAQQQGIDNRCRERMIRRCMPFVPPGAEVLELGFIDGQWTDQFLARDCRVQVVEGAERNVAYGMDKYRGDARVRFVAALFEDYDTDVRHDVVHMGGVLKHLAEPRAFLVRAARWLKPGGILIATTPNARSVHRRLGVSMGLLDDIHGLSDTDRAVANLRHYDRDSFRALLEGAGYHVVALGAAMVKFLSSQQMTDYSDALLDALDRLADDMPDMGWYLYAICRPADL